MIGSAKSRSLRYFFPVYLALLPFGSCAANGADPRVCDRIAIDFIKGDVEIWRGKIEGLARARGLTGPIIYVDIVAPTPNDGANKIRRMSLWWDAHPMAGAICKVGPDIYQRAAVNCAESVLGTKLKLDITFEPESARDAEMRTDELVKYVSSDVLCKSEQR